jgi:hypothetical protein
MANKGRLSFMKRQKEVKRKEKAAEKMARRQGKSERPYMDEEEILDGATDTSAASLSVQTSDAQTV